ncbi:MAG: cupin domain-containing protein [Ktedonobacteraceae bacterium]|nr:cupin domain-containing protein [Ktedonobacteraceae bacterium]
MQGYQFKTRAVSDVQADKRRGGEVRTLLSPKTVGSTSGFMGVATIGAGEKINEHYHPYSEEFIYVVRGSIVAQLNGEPCDLQEGQSLYIPIGTRHRLVNASGREAFIVFHLGPLAPRPDMGHVDTE